ADAVGVAVVLIVVIAVVVTRNAAVTA
ncbi:hypothetical protein A2U01_0012379, partial [Trifolium medium]|nr:hypothetical protein [Trifolium medium]